MGNNLLTKKLNDIVALYKAEQKYGELKFYSGNYAEQTVKILTEVCPCGKIATLYFNSTYQNFGREFSLVLKNAGFKPLSIIMPEDFSNSVEDYSRLFTLPDDIRCIITFDFSLNQSIKYYGAIKSIDTIHILTDFTSAEFLSPTSFVKNGAQFDRINLNCNQHIVIDDSIIKPDLPKIFAYTASKIINLIDYKIYVKLHSKRHLKSPYELLSASIDNTLTCFNVSIDSRKNYILENLFLAEISNRISDGIFWTISSENSVERLMPRFEGYDRIAFLRYTLGLYKKYFSGEYDHLLEIADYNTRVDSISKIINADEKKLMQDLLAQLENYNIQKDNLAKIKNTLLEQVVKTEKLIGQINSTYHALGGGGKENKDLRNCIYHSGDLNSTLNGMSLVRENGILEFIEV